MMSVRIPHRLGRAQNARMGWRQRWRESKREREKIRLVLAQYTPPDPPVVVRLVRERGARGRELDDDNLRACFKAVRDEVARWLGIDDGPRGGATWLYAEEKHGPQWAIRIEAKEAPDEQ
jgi:hypothetical protein